MNYNLNVLTMPLSLMIMLVMFLIITPQSVFAEIDVYDFDGITQENQFNQLIKSLRCPKCQNQSLADSDADIARDLKNLVYEKIKAGESNEEVIEFLFQRYGDFVTYKPLLSAKTLALWLFPFLLILLAILLIIVRINHSRKSKLMTVNNSKINAFLKEHDTHDVE